MKSIARAAALAALLLFPAGAHAALEEGTLYSGHINDNPSTEVSISVKADNTSPSGFAVDLYFSGIKLKCDNGTKSTASFSDTAQIDEDGNFHSPSPTPVLSAKISYFGHITGKKATGTVKYKSLNGPPTCKSGKLPWKAKPATM